jgi:hypothetical protein
MNSIEQFLLSQKLVKLDRQQLTYAVVNAQHHKHFEVTLCDSVVCFVCEPKLNSDDSYSESIWSGNTLESFTEKYVQLINNS